MPGLLHNGRRLLENVGRLEVVNKRLTLVNFGGRCFSLLGGSRLLTNVWHCKEMFGIITKCVVLIKKFGVTDICVALLKHVCYG